MLIMTIILVFAYIHERDRRVPPRPMDPIQKEFMRRYNERWCQQEGNPCKC